MLSEAELKVIAKEGNFILAKTIDLLSKFRRFMI